MRSQIEKGNPGANTLYWIFWTSLYQLLALALCFWVDIIPGFGTSGVCDAVS